MHWIFIAWDTEKKRIHKSYFCDKHPCYGRSHDPKIHPHPFIGLKDKHRIYGGVITGDIESEVLAKRTKNKGALEVINDEYCIALGCGKWTAFPVSVSPSRKQVIDKPDDIQPCAVLRKQ